MVDDGPMFRAAVAACMSGTRAGNGTRRLYLPQPPDRYQILSLDPTGLGGIVIGTGSPLDASCAIEGEAVRTWNSAINGGVSGGVRIVLGPNLNRPLLFVRKGVPSPVLRNLWLDGNRPGQRGWLGGPDQRLYVIQVEDDVSGPPVESSVRIYDSYLFSGYNGNLYMGANRGTLILSHIWSVYSGVNATDSSIFINSYDTFIEDPQVGGNSGYGISYASGTQHQMIGGAFFYNNIAEFIDGSVQHIAHQNVAYTNNYQNAVYAIGQTSVGSPNNASRIWMGVQFQNNSAGPENNETARGKYSDIYLTGGTITLEGVDFCTNDTMKRPKYHVECADSCTVLATNIKWQPGVSSTNGLANGPVNGPAKVVTYAPGALGVGTTSPEVSLQVKSGQQYDGISLTNGTHEVAKIFGGQEGNDGGNLVLSQQGTTKVLLSASYPSFVANSLGVGTQTPQATLDVNGFARLTMHTAAPTSCNLQTKGSIALNSQAVICACNGTSWIYADRSGMACNW